MFDGGHGASSYGDEHYAALMVGARLRIVPAILPSIRRNLQLWIDGSLKDGDDSDCRHGPVDDINQLMVAWLQTISQESTVPQHLQMRYKLDVLGLRCQMELPAVPMSQ